MGFGNPADAPYVNMSGKRVVVLGGSDTAMDCVRTSIRHGASRVICAYRRDEENMPSSRREVKNSREEGGEFMFNLHRSGRRWPGLRREDGAYRHGRTGCPWPSPRGNRRRRSEHIVDADAVVVAFGLRPHAMSWLADFSVELDGQGRIIAPEDGAAAFQTSNPNIFSGGDAVLGSDLVVTAIAESGGRHHEFSGSVNALLCVKSRKKPPRHRGCLLHHAQ